MRVLVVAAIATAHHAPAQVLTGWTPRRSPASTVKTSHLQASAQRHPVKPASPPPPAVSIGQGKATLPSNLYSLPALSAQPYVPLDRTGGGAWAIMAARSMLERAGCCDADRLRCALSRRFVDLQVVVWKVNIHLPVVNASSDEVIASDVVTIDLVGSGEWCNDSRACGRKLTLCGCGCGCGGGNQTAHSLTWKV